MTRIKICGNTEAAGVGSAVALEVDLLGFIFTRSPRRITVEQAQRLLEEVPESIMRVGVFIDEPAEVIAPIVSACGLTAVQIYRPPTPADRALGVALLPAIRVTADAFPNGLQVAEGDHPLLDTYRPDTDGGGSGRSWDWTLARDLARRYEVIVSGGLRPETVSDPIRTLRPWGVDVSSGVEGAVGVKDPARLKSFVAAVRAVGG